MTYDSYYEITRLNDHESVKGKVLSYLFNQYSLAYMNAITTYGSDPGYSVSSSYTENDVFFVIHLYKIEFSIDLTTHIGSDLYGVDVWNSISSIVHTLHHEVENIYTFRYVV